MDSFLDSNIPGSKNFFWKNALWLPKWKIYCVSNTAQDSCIISTCFKLEQIRSYFGQEISINSWLRPQVYNALPEIGGAKNSPHIEGLAVDFTIEGISCDDVRKALLPQLDTLKIRMENKPQSNWVHIDNRELLPGGKRFFIP